MTAALVARRRDLSEGRAWHSPGPKGPASRDRVTIVSERRFQPVSATNSASLSFGIIPPGVSLGIPL